jgi:uncharacterized protein YrrD
MQNSPEAEMTKATSGERSSEVNYAALLGKPVLTPGESPPASRNVRGAKVDFGAQRIVSLLVGDRKRPRWELPPSDVQTIEQKGVTVAGEASLRPLTHGGGRLVFAGQGGLIGAQLVGPRGDPIGTIVSLVFQLMDGAISRYEVSRGFLRDLLHGRRVLSSEEVARASMGELVVEE